MKNIFLHQRRNFLLILSGILLFSLSFPGFFVTEGLPFLAYVALFPVFYFVNRCNYREAFAYGALYGWGAYTLFNFWLKAFDPTAFMVVPPIYAGYFLMLFPLLKLAKEKLPRTGYLLQVGLWLSYEIFKGSNVFKYTYGTMGHALFRSTLVTGIADITGTYGVSLLVIFPSAFTAFFLSKPHLKGARKRILIPAASYLIFIVFSVVYTQVNKVDYSEAPVKKMSLVQHNIDSWLKKDENLHSRALDTLLRLSLEAEKEDPFAVIWSETAFVPSINWHWKYRTDPFKVRLIKKLYKHLNTSSAYYFIGNNEYYGPAREIKYNAALLFKKDEMLASNRKIELVPFTEQFPYKEQLSRLYRYAKDDLKVTFYDEGEEQILFDLKEFQAVTLICYEDTFSEPSRNATANGADLLVNMTNDLWSPEPACVLQHLSAAVFRTIENRRTMVRAGNGGYTTVISPNGEILASIPILEEGVLTYDVPIYNETETVYTRYGNIFDRIVIFLTLLTLSVFILKGLINRIKISVLKK